jgi:hypothetical protein
MAKMAVGRAWPEHCRIVPVPLLDNDDFADHLGVSGRRFIEPYDS